MRELIEKPSDDEDKYRIYMKYKPPEHLETHRTDTKSTDREEKTHEVKHDKKGECTFGDDEPYLVIFSWIFDKTIPDFLDFRHFSL